jgi:hypothetical protein
MIIEIKQARQFMYNITLVSVRIVIVAAEKRYYIF